MVIHTSEMTVSDTIVVDAMQVCLFCSLLGDLCTFSCSIPNVLLPFDGDCCWVQLTLCVAESN